MFKSFEWSYHTDRHQYYNDFSTRNDLYAYNSPLESGLYFEGNGLGRDEQAYYNDPYGEVAFSLPFRWDIHGRILRLDYGYDYPLLEIYDVYVAGDRLSGVLYVDGHMDGPVMLERQY